VPLINVTLIEGVFDAEKKKEIVRGLTEAMVAIEGENMRPGRGTCGGGYARCCRRRRPAGARA
jgi:Tautomerase enzyme